MLASSCLLYADTGNLVEAALLACLILYLLLQLAVVRDPNTPDTRVHACLYFIPPTGHRYGLARSVLKVIPTHHLLLV